MEDKIDEGGFEIIYVTGQNERSSTTTIPDKLTTTQIHIANQCDNIKELLISKNKDYGNSFAETINVFTNLNPIEQINVRLDDKLKRMLNEGEKNFNEDTELDFIGYLILRRVLREG